MSTQARRSRVASYGLIYQNDQLLLSRYASHSPDAGFWNLPGGGIEFGEHPEQAMIREVFEETGLDVIPTDLLGFDSITGQAHDHEFHHIRFVYAATVVGGELRSEVHGSSDLCAWHTQASLIDLPRIELVDIAIKMLKEEN